MKLLMLFFKGAEKKREPVKKTEREDKEKKLLESLCADDPEIYEALRQTLLLNIELARQTTLEEAIKRQDYFLAGGLALYYGDAEKVKECYQEHLKQWPGRPLKIVELSDEKLKKAIEKAREFYEQRKKVKEE